VSILLVPIISESNSPRFMYGSSSNRARLNHSMGETTEDIWRKRHE